MPTAPDGAVKAYIYGLMAAGRGDAPDIADALGMDDAQLTMHSRIGSGWAWCA